MQSLLLPPDLAPELYSPPITLSIPPIRGIAPLKGIWFKVFCVLEDEALSSKVLFLSCAFNRLLLCSIRLATTG